MSTLWNASSSGSEDLQPLIKLLARMGERDFTPSLLDGLHHWFQFQHFTVIRMDRSHPALLLAGTLHNDPELVWRCWRAYHHYDYQLYDPLFFRMQQSHDDNGTPQVGHMFAEDISFLPYRQQIYNANGMNERLSALSLDNQGTPILFNLYRHRESGFFCDRELAAFAQLAPFLCKLVYGHIAINPAAGYKQADISQLLKSRYPSLTAKELEVCALMLQGITYAGIAAERGVKESTIKTLRNRAFTKLGINYRAQLFKLLEN